MRAFLLRLLGAEPAPAPDVLPALLAALAERDDAAQADVAAVADAVQKLARAQARVSLKLEDIEGKLEAGLHDLRQSKATPEGAGLARLDPLLDAVDLLEEATRAAARSGDAALADGVRGIGARLVTFLEQAGVSRVAAAGVVPEARLFRVVGTEAASDQPAGVITRVVRAAVLSGTKVVREGEVLVAAHTGGDT